MSYQWPADTDFAQWELDVVDRACSVCGRTMYICDHRYRRLHTLDGPVELLCRLNHCPDRTCPGHARTKSPELETSIAPPRWAIGWDVFCWIGQRRFSRHRSIASDSSGPLGRSRHQALGRRSHEVCPSLPSHARGPSARPCVASPALRIRGSTRVVHRRPPAGERARNALCRAGIDGQAGLVRRAVAVGDGRGGPTFDRQGQGVGQGLGQVGGAVDSRTGRTLL